MAAEQRVEGWATADVAEPEEHFFLRVTGDSMINAGIRDGDLVLLRRQDTACLLYTSYQLSYTSIPARPQRRLV